MHPLEQNRLAQAVKTIISRVNKYYSQRLNERRPIKVVNPIQNLVNGLSTTLTQITKRPVEEDYNAVVRGFLPDGIKPLKPQDKRNSREYFFADIDGDSRNELISSFKHGDDLRTIILKKKDEKWQKAAEFNSPGYEAINYRGVADITGEGKKQLLLGLASKDNNSVLHGFSFDNNMVKKLFNRNYHRFEVINQPKESNAASKAQLAIWNKRDADAFNIEVLDWNGSQLEAHKDTAPYYYRKVVPYYLRKVEQLPHSASNWYNLADALVTAELFRDAKVAIKVGTNKDRKSLLKDKFTALKSTIPDKE